VAAKRFTLEKDINTCVMQISLLLYKNNQKQNIKKKRNGKKKKELLNATITAWQLNGPTFFCNRVAM